MTLTRRFAAAYGRGPAGVWAAPGRVNLIGEHTDYNDGFVLPFALDRCTAAAVSLRADDRLRVASLQQDGAPVEVALSDVRPGRPAGWAAYVAGVLWAMRGAGHPVGGMDVLVDGRVPVGAGLSSSAALECAVALAADELHALGLPRTELAALARRAENEVVGVPTGGMDQLAALLCVEGHALFLDTRSGQAEQVPLELDGAGLRILVIDTRVRRSLGESAYAERRRTCTEAARALGVPALRDVPLADLDRCLRSLPDPTVRRRVRHVVTENSRVLATVVALRTGDWAEVGRLMTASHVSLRDDYEVSCAVLDTAVEAALGSGALGARMTGGGFGGCALALVAAGGVGGTQNAVRRAAAQHGFPEPDIFVATPSGAARRLHE